MKFVVLETTNLLLKGISPEHMNEIFMNYPQEEVMLLLGHEQEEEFLNEKNKNDKGYAAYNRRFILFLLVHKESQKIIGRCGIHNWNQEHQRAELGYVMHHEAYRNKGFMKEAISAIIEYGFTQLMLNRLEAVCSIHNMASIRILLSFHFKQEGILRAYFNRNNSFEDALCFSLLQNAWHKSTEPIKENEPSI
ncbi:MAG: GNAT family N-acetyltransferase [Chitinophagaceae bacterium]|nr:GNAT family N-acetyltransferase [Chitinophagaceae bacterium]